MTERETMIQCLACEVCLVYWIIQRVLMSFQDWLHESCLNLRERPSSRETTPTKDINEQEQGEDASGGDAEDDANSDASSSGLPPPLISGSKYESLICGSCVSKVPTLKKYAGTPGVLMVVRDAEDKPWMVIDGEVSVVDVTGEEIDVAGDEPDSESRRKRSRSPNGDEPDAKRAKVDGSACLAPPVNPAAQDVFKRLTQEDRQLGSGDLFFTEGFRERWCRCPSVRVHYIFISLVLIFCSVCRL